MNSKEYNEFASTTDISTHDLNYYLKGLVEEFGEVFGELKRVDRDDDGVITKERFDKIINELSDVEWYKIRMLNKICEISGNNFISLEEIWQININKLKDRKERGVIKGEGSSR